MVRPPSACRHRDPAGVGIGVVVSVDVVGVVGAVVGGGIGRRVETLLILFLMRLNGSPMLTEKEREEESEKSFSSFFEFGGCQVFGRLPNLPICDEGGMGMTWQMRCLICICSK